MDVPDGHTFSVDTKTILDGVRHRNTLIDGMISDEEFRLVLSEINKYNQMKTEMRDNRKLYSCSTGAGLPEDEQRRANQARERGSPGFNQGQTSSGLT